MRYHWPLVAALVAAPVVWSASARAQEPAAPAPAPAPAPTPAPDAAPAPAPAPAPDAAPVAEVAPPADAAPAAAPQAAPVPVAAPQAAPDPDAPDPAALKQAIVHFKQGRAFAQSGDCRGAIVQFQAAYDLVPRPSALYNIAQCQERLFRYDLAIEFYNSFLERSGPDEPDRDAVLTAIGVLKGLLATITIESSVPAEVWVGERLAGNAPGRVLVPGGTYTVELRAKGYEAERREVTVIGQQQLTMEFSLSELSTYEGLDSLYFYSTAAATVALAAVGTVFGLQAMGKSSDADSGDPERNTEATLEDIRDTQNLADIFFGAAGVVGISSMVLYFMTDWDDEAAPDPTQGLDVQAVVHGDGAAVMVRGSL